jgi:hypothetical protein
VLNATRPAYRGCSKWRLCPDWNGRRHSSFADPARLALVDWAAMRSPQVGAGGDTVTRRPGGGKKRGLPGDTRFILLL